MHSDELIRKLLKAAAIVEGAYCILTLILCAAADTLTKGFAGSNVNDTRLGFPLPLAAEAILLTGFFFIVWSVLHNAVDPQKYSALGGALLIVNTVISWVSTTVVTIAVSRFYAAAYGSAYLAKFAMFRGSYINYVQVFRSAAAIILYIVLGMEWYRAALINEQMMNNKQTFDNSSNI